MRLFFALALLLAAPSFGAGLSSRPADEVSQTTPLEGFYVGAGGGGAFIILPAGNGFGYDAEARLGYSFNPGLQLFLSGAIDGATISGLPFRSEIVAAYLQYHLFARPGIGVYARAGIGLALSSSFVQSAAGLATGGGLGLEIGLGNSLFIAPEFFYKNANLTLNNGGGSTSEQVLGVQLSLIFY